MVVFENSYYIWCYRYFNRNIGRDDFWLERLLRGKPFWRPFSCFQWFFLLQSLDSFLLSSLAKNSLAGQAIEWLFNQPIIFTWWAAVIASAVVAFPLMYQSAKSGFQGVDLDIEEAARVDGASEWKIFLFISIPLASKALISGSILSLARALGEFGATLMFAGNIPGETQTIPTAIYIAIDSGNMKMAWLWVISIVIISFIMLLTVRVKQE